MCERTKVIILIAILGVLCPNLLIMVMGRRDTVEPVAAVATEAGEAPPKAEDADRMIAVLDRDGMVREIAEDAYLRSVILCEMPAEFELEALKAQAVVARTYALRRVNDSTKHTNAAVCMDPSCCQGYKSVEDYLSQGGKVSDVEKIERAVSETKNMVLTYNGKLIEATYFSCSGGHTEDALAVWGTDIPYLRAIPSPGEEHAARYTDTVTFTTAEFAKKLGCNMPENTNNLVDNVAYTAGGGVETLNICGKKFTGTAVRQCLGLRSTAFAITAVGDSVTVTTKGFGHRVGMSQYGADAMAAAGSSFDEILLYYYRGVTLSRYISGN